MGSHSSLNRFAVPLAIILNMGWVRSVRADEAPLPQAWEYLSAMKKVAARFHGRPGVVLHIGDSITYANPYGQWARAGQGKTAEDKAVLAWMHAGINNNSDGWWLASYDHPDGGRSFTACGGIRIDEILAGGKQHLPSLAMLLQTYQPQMVVMMLGTNDVSANRLPDDYQADMEKAIRLILNEGIICIPSTIPPHPGNPPKALAFNGALRRLAQTYHLPLIDYEQEILKRRPHDWNGTLIQRNDPHPTATQGGTSPASEPTPQNLRNSGYLLRGWLSVKKITEVKSKILG